MDEEYSFPTTRSFLGDVILVVGVVMLALDTLFVSMRIWGRRRYSRTPRQSSVSYGEPRYWVVVSDAAILFSYLCAIGLVAIGIYAVRCGEGLHYSQLTLPQQTQKLKVLYVYSILSVICPQLLYAATVLTQVSIYINHSYKFIVPIPKIATVFLFLAIAPPHLRAFIACCKMTAAYMVTYCVVTTFVAIFQCGPDVSINWLSPGKPGYCINLATFWTAQFAVDISACLIMVGLPWWLFASIQYKRKNVIATVLSTLAIGETILAATSLWLLAKVLTEAVKPNPDIAHSESVGLVVSQLHVNFGCISACVPTVLKLFEEGWVALGGRIKWIERTLNTSQQKSQSTGRRSTAIHLSALKSAERGATSGGDNSGVGGNRSKTPVLVGPYLNPECDDDDGSMGSQQRIISKSGGGNIQVQTEVSISVETDRDCTAEDRNADLLSRRASTLACVVVAKHFEIIDI
ncbi:hypothetical protein PG984_013048 [Apiospora sp. TS-2023a]